MSADQYRLWEIRLHQLNLVNSFAQTCVATNTDSDTAKKALSMLYDYIRKSITDEKLIQILDDIAKNHRLIENDISKQTVQDK